MLSDDQLQKKIQALSNKLNLGNHDEVIAEVLNLIKKNKHQVFFNILSLAYQSKGELDKSEKIMEEALKIDPNNPFFLNNMGVTQHKIGNFIKAEEYFNRGLKKVPNYVNILNNLGNLKKDLDQTNEALEYYKKSLSINPKVIQTLLNISICLQSLGKFKESKNYLNKLLEIDPEFTIADRLISSMTKYDKGNIHFESMLDKLKKIKLNDFQLANLFFGIGKAYEDLKVYDQSFQNYSKGNSLLKKISNYKIEDEKKNFDKIKEIFSENLVNILPDNSRKIIFIVGMPRSGTSLIEQILSSHKDVYGGGELVFLKKIINKKILKNFENKNEKIVENSENLFQEIHDEYLNNISQINISKNAFTDKAPLNFMYIGFIKKIFPNSKIINCKRNSLDICWSNFKNYFAEGLPFTNNLSDLANFYKMYISLMKFWEKKFPNEIYEMDYTRLINKPEIEIKKMLNFCQLDWDQNCMKHEKNTKTVKTASATQVRKPINKAGLNTFEPFKSYLSELTNMLEN